MQTWSHRSWYPCDSELAPTHGAAARSLKSVNMAARLEGLSSHSRPARSRRARSLGSLDHHRMAAPTRKSCILSTSGRAWPRPQSRHLAPLGIHSRNRTTMKLRCAVTRTACTKRESGFVPTRSRTARSVMPRQPVDRWWRIERAGAPVESVPCDACIALSAP
jgi:hypothetical protein